MQPRKFWENNDPDFDAEGRKVLGAQPVRMYSSINVIHKHPDTGGVIHVGRCSFSYIY